MSKQNSSFSQVELEIQATKSGHATELRVFPLTAMSGNEIEDQNYQRYYQ